MSTYERVMEDQARELRKALTEARQVTMPAAVLLTRFICLFVPMSIPLLIFVKGSGYEQPITLCFIGIFFLAIAAFYVYVFFRDLVEKRDPENVVATCLVHYPNVLSYLQDKDKRLADAAEEYRRENGLSVVRILYSRCWAFFSQYFSFSGS